MDAIGAVAIGEEKSAIRQEGIIRRHESIPTPALHGLRIFILEINPRIHRSVLFPNLFTFEREFGETLHLLIRRHVKELLLALGAHFEAVAATLELIAEPADELAFVIENENGRVV